MGRRRGEKRGKGQDGRRSRARESGTDGMVRSDGGEERCREGRDAARDEWKERRCGEVVAEGAKFIVSTEAGIEGAKERGKEGKEGV